jgi:hypothetical protein
LKHWHYLYAGLRVASDLQIPEWATFEQPQPEDEADLMILLADMPDEGPANGEIPPFISADEYRFHVPDVGSYLVLKGREITVAPFPGAGLNEVRLFLLGTAWGALCYQRGLLVLHAGAIQVDKGAVAFCGTAGMGKSTITAWMCAHGYPFVCDDLSRFDIPDCGEPLVYPSTPRLKLWRDALMSLGINNEELQRDFLRFDKFHLPWSVDEPLKPLPLRGIYLLEWGASDILRLSGRTALSRFLSAATYRGVLIEPMGRMSAYWRSCLELVRRVPVWELTRPRDLSSMDKTVRLLERHWLETGLGADKRIIPETADGQ